MTEERFQELREKSRNLALVDSRDLREALNEIESLWFERIDAIRQLKEMTDKLKTK